MRPGEVVDCIYCLAPLSLSFRIGKKGHFFCLCGVCGSRTFFHGAGLTGPTKLWGKMTMALKAGEDDVARELIKREVERAGLENADG